MMKNGVFYFGIPYFVPEIFKFLLKILVTLLKHCEMTVMNQKIENISKNIGVMIFKLGTRNVHYIRHKVTPLKMLPCQQSCSQSFSAMNQTSWTLNR